MKKYMSFYRILGLSLVVISLIGFLTVADEFRHMGEFIGVCSILLAGIIFIIAESNLNTFKHLALQWIAFGVLAGIPIGGILLDNMPIGVSTGFLIGIFFSFVFKKKKLNN